MKRDRINYLAENLHCPYFFEEYDIQRKTEGNLIILNYDRTAPPNSINCLCRGTIFHRNGTLLMFPFERFFNEHEPFVANVDWRSACVLEKVDGTMMSAWYDEEQCSFRLSTKRMVDKLWVDSFGGGPKVDLAQTFTSFFPNYQEVLDPRYMYVFELVSAENRIVRKYPSNLYGLYLLCMRHRQSLDELSPWRLEEIVKSYDSQRVRVPLRYGPRQRSEIKALFENRPDDWEGVVIIDSQSRRMKIKSTSYVKLHAVLSGALASPKNMINLILDGEEGEILAYFPELEERFSDLKRKLNMLKRDIMTVYGLYNSLETQKEFALAVKDLPYASFLFRLRKGEDLKYSFMNMGGKKLEKYL